jgi:hypothetical protein
MRKVAAVAVLFLFMPARVALAGPDDKSAPDRRQSQDEKISVVPPFTTLPDGSPIPKIEPIPEFVCILEVYHLGVGDEVTVCPKGCDAERARVLMVWTTMDNKTAYLTKLVQSKELLTIVTTAKPQDKIAFATEFYRWGKGEKSPPGAPPVPTTAVATLDTPVVPAQSREDIAKERWGEKLFGSELTHDFGTVAYGTLLSHRFKFANPYKTPLNITAVRLSSSKVTAKPTQECLQPGETAYIEVSMDTKYFVGAKTVAVYVSMAGNGGVSEVRLLVTANAQEK